MNLSKHFKRNSKDPRQSSMEKFRPSSVETKEAIISVETFNDDHSSLTSLKSHRSSGATDGVKLNFKLLNKLYGRTKPQTQLVEAFQRVCEPESNVEVVMIHGVSGVGKTALVQDWKKCVVSKTPTAYFLEAKYHQVSSMSEPFAAFKVAFRQLIDHLSDDEDLAKIKKILSETLGSQLRPLRIILPSLSKILLNADDDNNNDEEAAPDDVSTRTSSVNTNYAMMQLGLVFVRVLRLIGRPTHPVVLFLDDIQWADEDSLDLISSLMVEEDCQNFMLVGAYRVETLPGSRPSSTDLTVQSLVTRLSSESSQSTSLSQTRLSSRNFARSGRKESMRNLLGRVISSRKIPTDNEQPRDTLNSHSSTRSYFQRGFSGRFKLWNSGSNANSFKTVTDDSDVPPAVPEDCSLGTRLPDESIPPRKGVLKNSPGPLVRKGRPSQHESDHSVSQGLERRERRHSANRNWGRPMLSASNDSLSQRWIGRKKHELQPRRAASTSESRVSFIGRKKQELQPRRAASTSESRVSFGAPGHRLPSLNESPTRTFATSGPRVTRSSVTSDIASISDSFAACDSVRKPKIADIELSYLSLDSVNDIISGLTELKQEDSMPLASIVKLKTHGNAFSVLRFLEMLQRDGLLTFSLRVYRWEWDADRINAETSVTANVGELLAARIETLPSQMKGFLMMAACIGQSFHEEILEQVAVEESLSGTSTEVGEGESEEVVRKLCRACLHRVLRQSCRAGLIEREEKQSTYRFSHDLVHKCLYSMIKKQNLQPLHLRIGRAMRQHDSFETDEKAVFATVNHLNEGAYHIDDEEERIFLLKLNLETSERAKAAYSFHSAAIFLEKGILNVDHSEDWDTHYDLVLEIYTSAAEVQYARGKLEKSLELADEVIAHARCIEDEVRAHFIKVNVLGVQRKLSEALEEGFKVLDLLGCHIPRKLKKVHLFMDLMQIRKIMLGKSAEAFMSMAPMTDVLKVYTLRLLDSMTLLLWMIGDDSQVSILMTRMILITLKHGVSVYSPFSFASYGMLLSYMGDERGAYRFGTLALQLAGSLRSKLSLARTALIVYTFTNHLNNPLIDSLDPMLNAHRLGLQVGDVEYSSMCLCTYASLYVTVGLPLQPYVEDMKQFCEQLKLHKQQQCVALITPYWQLALNLMGKAEDPLVLSGEAMDRESFMKSEDLEDRDQGVAMSNLRFVLLVLAYVFQDIDELENWLKERARYGSGVITGTHFLNYFEVLFTGLASFSVYRATGKKKHRKRAKQALTSMKVLVKTCGMNCHPMYKLLYAEKKSLGQDIERTRKCYDEAISTFARCGFIHLEAIACERAGDYMAACSDTFWSHTYYSRSQVRYLEWGASAKAELLSTDHNLRNFKFKKKVQMHISMRGKRRYDPSTWALITES